MFSRITSAVAAAITTVLICLPVVASAATTGQTIGTLGIGVGAGLLLSQALNNAANNACNACQNVDASKPNYCANITCSLTTGGLAVTGKCGAPGQCRGQSGQGLDGTMQAFGLGLQVVGLLTSLALLKQANTNTAPPAPIPQTGCASFVTVTTPSSDPCTVYNPTPISSAISANEAIGGSSGSQDTYNYTPVSDSLLNLMNQIGTSSSATSSSDTNGQLENLAGLSSSTKNVSVSSSTVATQNSLNDLHGDTSGTIIGNVREGIAEVAGFFGSNWGNTTQSGGLCTNRPWATGLIAKIIPPSVFDAACAKLGYQVGKLDIVNPVRQEMQTFTSQTQKTTPTSEQTIAVPLSADIWADPPLVRLSTRTKVFWSSKNADSCVILGPSFEQHSLSGGGATVPIVGPTTFTITCTAGKYTARDSVTVDLAI